MEHKYAVVKFPLENSVGIICTKWIVEESKGECYYPDSQIYNMNAILKRHQDVLPGWIKCPVMILKTCGKILLNFLLVTVLKGLAPTYWQGVFP